MLKFLYIFFLGVILAFFVGLGIEAFYASPKNPDYPNELQYSQKTPAQMTTEDKQIQIDYDKKMVEYQKVAAIHGRNVSMIAVAAAVLLLVLSLTILLNTAIVTDGFLLGGLLTLLYAIIRGFESDNSMYRFALVTVGLVIVMTLGYFKFIKPGKKKGRRR